jgi:hypothetical protein
MDAEVVNRTKDPVELVWRLKASARLGRQFQSRYPSFPVRSVMVQGGDQTSNKSTPLEFKQKFPKYQTGNLSHQGSEDTGTTYVETINYRVTSKKVETGGLKLSSQYPVLSGFRADAEVYRRPQKRNQ